MSTSKLDAASIARISLHDSDPAHFSIQHSQTIHRLELLQRWNIPTGSKVLELGCGQGDCTTVLASAVGEQGKVVAVDPAELDYGEVPFSLFLVYPACLSAESCTARRGRPADGFLQVPHILSAKPRVTSRRAR